MKVRRYWLFLLLIMPILLGVGAVMADRDDEEGESFYSHWFKSDSMRVGAQGSKLYQDECGGCHFPFQPGFLPAVSWQAVMTGLDDHFGENAELMDEDHALVLNYLTTHSADSVDREISNKVIWSLRSVPAPLRITETAFFRHEHDEIVPGMLRHSGDKISFSNCDACHTKALQGSYDEDEIDIPGFGRWDD